MYNTLTFNADLTQAYICGLLRNSQWTLDSLQLIKVRTVSVFEYVRFYPRSQAAYNELPIMRSERGRGVLQIQLPFILYHLYAHETSPKCIHPCYKHRRCFMINLIILMREASFQFVTSISSTYFISIVYCCNP